MGSKGSNTTTTQTNSNNSWQADPAARDAYLRLLGRAENVASTPYQAYTGEMVAGFTPFQQQAFDATQAAQGAYQPYIQQGFGAAQQALTPSYQNVNSYISPYIQNVVDATRANFDESNAQAQQQVVGNAALKGALGGDRVGVAQAELARQQKLAQDPVIANLYNQGYTTALGAAQTDANRALSAGNLYGSLAQTGQGLNYGDINALYGMGSQQQQLNQAQLNVPYQQFLEQRAFPYQQAQWLAGLQTGVGSQLGGTSTGTSTGTTTPPKPNPLNTALGLGMTAASFFLNRGGRIPRAEGGIAVPYSGGYIPTVNLTPRPMQAPQMPQAKAPQATPADNSAEGLIKQATSLAGHIRDSMRSQPMNINPTGIFNPTPVGSVAPSIFGSDPGIGRIYAHGGKVLDMERDPRGIYVPRKHYDGGGGVSFNDAWNDRVFEPSQDAAWRSSDNPRGLGAGLARSGAEPVRTAGAGEDVSWPVSAGPGTGSVVPMGYSPEPSITGVPSGLGGPGLGAAPVAGQAQPSGGGLFNLSDQARQGMLAAGLGMMASKSPFVGQAIGEGGLAGVGVYREAMKLKEAAERARENLAETSRHHRASEAVARDRLDQENWQYIGATEEGLPIYMDRRSGEERVGETKTVGRPSAGGKAGQTERLIAELRKENPSLTYAEALALTKRAPNADMAALRRESLALQAAKNDVGYLSNADATIDKYRKKYGLTASPEAPAASPPAPAAAPARPTSKPDQDAIIAKARAAIAKGAPRDEVVKRLQKNGYDPSGL